MYWDEKKFMTMEKCYEGAIRLQNGSPHVIKGKVYIALNDNITCDDFIEKMGWSINFFMGILLNKIH